MGVDQPSQRFAIGGFADVPVVKMGELTQTCAPAGFRHACEAEIDAIGEDDREQRIAIVGFPARTTMDEAFAEPGPGIDLQQKIGDLHARQSIIGGATGNLGGGRCCRLQRRDDETVFVKLNLGQLPCRARTVTCSIAVSSLVRRSSIWRSKSVSMASGNGPFSRSAAKVAGGMR